MHRLLKHRLLKYSAFIPAATLAARPGGVVYHTTTPNSPELTAS